MFDTNFDLDDDGILGTSFAVVSSTQKCKVIEKENLKRFKPYENFSNQITSGPKGSSFVTPPNQFTEISSVNVCNKAVKRRFPGPAGLLPERSERRVGDRPTSNVLSIEGCNTDNPRDDLLLCSQRTVSVFEDGPWKEMTKDYYVPNGECPYNKYNISWIKKQASIKKLLVNHKAPFLAAIIQSLEILDHKVPVINIVLKDATGEIQGTVLHSLYEEYDNLFTIGSVLVLKQFGVLSTGYNNHCLTITPNNLVTIYCLDVCKKPQNSGDNVTVSCADRCNVVTKVVIQNCCIDEIIRQYHEDTLANKQKEKTINFGKIYHNHGILRHVSDNEDTFRLLRNDKLQEENSICSKKFIMPQSKNCFNRTNYVNCDLPVETMSNVVCDDTSKKKFNFKRTESLQNLTNFTDVQSKSTDISVINVNKDLIILDTNHVSNKRTDCQISVRPDNKEHTEIWKNVLEGIDTDSLFEDF